MTPKALLEPARLAGTPLLRSQTDERLVDLTRAGNARAFEAIVHRYRRPLLRYCSRLLPAEQAEDTVQQAFVRAYEAIRAGDAQLNLRPWLYRIAHNAAIDAMRRSGQPHEELPEHIDGVERPDQAFERSERLGAVLAAVQGLPERQRNAVVLRELEGRSYEEIAAALGVTDGAVRQLLNRARSSLRTAATAATPGPLAARLAAGGEGESIGARVAEAVGGVGAAATLAKVGAAVLVTGAVAGTVADAPVPALGDRDGGKHEAHAATDVAEATPTGTDATSNEEPVSRDGAGREGSIVRSGDRDGRRGGDGDDDRSGRRDGDDDDDDDNSGPGSGDDLDDDDNSGPGSGDDLDDHDNSGPGSGGDTSGSGSGSSGSGGGGSSGSGSGSSGSSGGDTSGSGSGSSGSGSSGSGSSGSGSSGSGSSGSGSSGSSG